MNKKERIRGLSDQLVEVLDYLATHKDNHYDMEEWIHDCLEKYG